VEAGVVTFVAYYAITNIRKKEAKRTYIDFGARVAVATEI